MKKVILALVLTVLLASCNKQKGISYAYKYADKEAFLNCEDQNNKLLNEAYYAFENAVMIQAKNTMRNPNAVVVPNRVLRGFVARSSGNMDASYLITKETLDVFKALKEAGIVTKEPFMSQSAIIDCINQSMNSSDIKRSFSALRQVEETLDSKLIVMATVNASGASQYDDKALMTYVALDRFYKSFYDVDFTDFKFLEEVAKEEAPKVTLKQPETKDPHAGHNHGPHDGHNH